jgi:SAM-dependent methyltransferase
MDDWLGTNQRMWDERVPWHTASDFYDVDGFKSGRPELLAFEVPELGPLDGLALVHLQCHFGLDTLDIARMHPTVAVTGLDFSAPAIDAAVQLAAEVRLADRARFVVSDVYRATEVLGDERFDVVYTGKGALGWLPDLDGWAKVVRDLLAPGGFLYLCEFHPIMGVLADKEPVLVYDYFATAPMIFEEAGSYATPEASTVHNTGYWWQHPIGRVITALLGVGLRLEFFHEWDYMIHELHPWLVLGEDGRIRWPEGSGTLPLMYSLKAIRPDD